MTYSMIGALNKIPITFLSVLFFHVAFTWKTAISVTVGLSAGMFDNFRCTLLSDSQF